MPRRRSPARCSTRSSPRRRVSAWRGETIGLADPPGATTLLEEAHFVVVDLETTGLSPRDRQGSVRSARSASARSSSSGCLRDVRRSGRARSRPLVSRLTGIDQRALRGAPRSPAAVRQLLRFTGDAAIVAHNARFDLAFLDREVERMSGQRIAAPGGRHGVARSASARRANAACRPRVARAPARRSDGAVPPSAPRCPGDRRDPRHPDRARAGARRENRLRSGRAGGAARSTAQRQARARRGSADDTRDVRVPR